MISFQFYYNLNNVYPIKTPDYDCVQSHRLPHLLGRDPVTFMVWLLCKRVALAVLVPQLLLLLHGCISLHAEPGHAVRSRNAGVQRIEKAGLSEKATLPFSDVQQVNKLEMCFSQRHKQPASAAARALVTAMCICTSSISKK
jgi:hypothetical protein